MRPGNDNISGLFLLAGDPKTMDEALILVSREAEVLEKSLAMKHGEARLSVRNLEYGEPSPAFSPLSPFKPVPSITIYPWGGSQHDGQSSDFILLDSLSAFGSGTHPTTMLCLEFLEKMFLRADSGIGCVEGRMPLELNNLSTDELPGLSEAESGAVTTFEPGSTVLDFGCGTGILAIAAVRLGALRAVGVEIDHEAAQTACRNVRLNRLDPEITIIEGSLDVLSSNYTIILANLVAAAHLRVGTGLAKHLNPAGHLLISGFSVSQTAQIEKIYKEYVLEVIERREKEGWAAVLFHKP
jgi:ribosomal protein L11 methyltransferase